MRKNGITEEQFEAAMRLRQIRMNAGLTQEQLAEILEISLSAYKKIESAENQISIEGLRKLEKKLNVSSDYILFGKLEGLDDTWKMILNCSEKDKLFLMLRLMKYFSVVKQGRYCVKEEQDNYDSDILRVLREMEI